MKRRILLPLAFGLLALACDSPHVERIPVKDQGLDDRITLHGTVCTRPPDPDGFPVKVLFVVDQSGSMCITDPPDSQQGGLCTNFKAGGTYDPNDPAFATTNNYCETENGAAWPARVCSLYQIVKSFIGKPNVQAGIFGFESKIQDVFPAQGAPSFFAPVDDASFANNWLPSINFLKTSLGKATDYQGALAEAYVRIQADILQVSRTNKSQLPRTRYVVVFITDGTPFPRCAADDTLPPQNYATVANPDLIWPDSPGAIDGQTGANYCNEEAISSVIANGASPAFPGVDRNQNYQILSTVDQIMSLQKTYNVHQIQVHTILMWNGGNISTLGPAEQQDLFGDVGNCSGTQCVTYEHSVAEHLLQEIAQKGNGTYQQFTDLAKLELGSLDYTSLYAPFVMKNLIVDNVTAHPRPSGQVPDSDGDGLPDDLDNQTVLHTNGLYQDSERANQDTDDDGFNDQFEYAHAQQGFDATQPDARQQAQGCDPNSDGDGDGLLDCSEQYLKSDPGLVDSDSDGVPDGLEARYGLDPAEGESPLQDSDGDGVPDLQEIRAHTDPHVADPALAAQESYRYAFAPSSFDGGNGANCYDYAVSNIRMVTTQTENADQSVASQNGHNHFVIYFDEAPESSTTADYGEWKMACANAQFSPPTVRKPQGPDLEVDDPSFQPSNGFKGWQFANGCVEAQ